MCDCSGFSEIPIERRSGNSAVFEFGVCLGMFGRKSTYYILVIRKLHLKYVSDS